MSCDYLFMIKFILDRDCIGIFCRLLCNKDYHLIRRNLNQDNKK